jgi:hypothetical protein
VGKGTMTLNIAHTSSQLQNTVAYRKVLTRPERPVSAHRKRKEKAPVFVTKRNTRVPNNGKTIDLTLLQTSQSLDKGHRETNNTLTAS